jgi:adenosylcobinamide-GDP ribazoletransferase
MASVIHDTLAWLRFYGAPIRPLAGEETTQAPDYAATAHLVPVAGAVIGAVGAIVLIAASGLRLPAFLAATLAVAGLVVATGALPERALAQTAERLAAGASRAVGDPLAVFGVLALVLALFMRVGAVEGLIGFGSLYAALALIAAGGVSRAAALAMTPDFASHSAADDGGLSPFQRLALAALVIAAILVLPTYGIGAALAGVAAAVAAAAGVLAVASRLSGEDGRPLAGAAEQAAEIAFLVAVLVFARSP